MPVSVVNTEQDEKKWDEAKELADKQYPDKKGSKSYWAIVMSIFKKKKGFKKLKKALPSDKDNKISEGYNIGDEKQFADGSVRRLDTTVGTGVRRWFGIGKDESTDTGGTPEMQISDELPQSIEDKIPEGIEKEEWVKFNKYLTSDNPFYDCKTYNELTVRWFACAYEYDERLRINEKMPDEKILNNIKKEIAELDNCLLAVMMYKISYVIKEIKEWEPEFDYDNFIKDNDWNQLYEYFEKMKEPVIVDYTQLYE